MRIKPPTSNQYVEHYLRGRRSKRQALIEKQKPTRGPYSRDQLVRQAIDIKAKQIKNYWSMRGKELTHEQAVKMAVEIAEHHGKRFS